jgi:formylmethanofuran dehydrogenase subunit E
MTIIAPFYSANEIRKPEGARVYHNNDQCELGKEVMPHERRAGDNGYPLCDNCRHLAFKRRLAMARQLSAR